MNTLPSPSRSICVQSLHLFTIIIDQTTLKDDLSLIISHRTKSKFKLFCLSIFDHIRCNLGLFVLDCFTDIRDANQYIADGKTPVSWNFSTIPSETWKDGVGSALLEYAQGTGDWDAVVSAFVDGWATEYAAANGQ